MKSLMGSVRSYVHKRLHPSQHAAIEQQRSIFENAIREIVGFDETFELRADPLPNGQAKMTLVTESRRVMVAWVEVQDAWLEVQTKFQQEAVK